MKLLDRPRWRARVSLRKWALLTATLVVCSALILLLLGRVPYCECNVVALWHGTIDSNQTSQQLTDWYTLSHVIYGFIFYGLVWLVGRNLSIGARLFVAVFLEAAWEIVENTDPIINQFRSVNIWRGYFGDSVLNSVGDIVAMVAGFVLAHRLQIWASIAVIAVIDVTAAFVIRDSLVIGTVMFFRPVDFIAQWQSGGG